MTELYTAAEAAKTIRNRKTCLWLTCAAAGLTLIACVGMCVLTNTGNAAVMERRTIVTAILGGWLSIWLLLNPLAALRAEEKHNDTIARGREEAEYLTGSVTIEQQVICIAKSIDIQKLRVETGTEQRRVNIHCRRAKALQPLQGKRLRLQVIHGYVTGWEVLE